jgi:hypothetical protein
MPLAVEEVITNVRARRRGAILIRHGRADPAARAVWKLVLGPS